MFVLFSLWFCRASFAEETSPVDDFEAPIFIGGRTSLGISTGRGSIFSVGGTMGLDLGPEGRTALGMRFIYVQNPPDNPFETYTPEVPSAWGPVMDFYFFPNPNARLAPFCMFSGGFIYGVPKDESENNVILPIVELAVGMRFQRKISEKDTFYIAPDMGVIPELWVPFVGLNFGIKSR
ncbi:MAG: hypothetical protein VX278_19015 [Myxococcota bacterium]|nr:hypothetical protein [Myxococcota bacterium]